MRRSPHPAGPNTPPPPPTEIEAKSLALALRLKPVPLRAWRGAGGGSRWPAVSGSE